MPSLTENLAALRKLKAEQRATEAPLRAARRKLKARLDSTLKSVNRYNQKISDELLQKGAGSVFFNHYKLEDAERSLANASAAFKARLADLMAFDIANHIEGADYPQLPVLDREATLAAGKAEREKSMADIRARMQRDFYATPQHPTAAPRNPLDAIFGDVPEPDYKHPRLR